MTRALHTIGIAGAGLLGRVLAFQLAEAGYRITLFDRDQRSGRASCGYVGAGMLTPYTELERAEPLIAELGLRALELWPKLLNRLTTPVFFQRCGTLVVAHRQDWGELNAFHARLAGRGMAGIPIRSVTGDEITALAPGLADRFSRGYFIDDEGQLEARALFPALEAALGASPLVDWRAEVEVQAVEPHGVKTAEGVHHFDLAVDCRGLGARSEVPGLRGVRGELIRFHAPEVALPCMVRLMHPRYPLYIVPRPDHQFVIGATSIESDDMGPITVKSSLELLSAAYSLHPGFAEARILESAVHCRPALPDNLPRIRLETGLLRINGLYRHGYLITPALVEASLSVIQNGSTQFPRLLEE